jgi:1,4-alpha-glucan branching enzyme
MRVPKGQTGKRKVTFKVRAPAAKEVIVVGDFDNWNPHDHPMEKDDEGFWKVTMMLAPGRYEYKLLIDGQWWEDIRGVNSIKNPFGTLNKLLYVPEQ